MRIDAVSLNLVRMRLVSPFETSFGRIDHRECIVIQVFSGDLTGIGECVADRDPGYSYETSGTAFEILQNFLVPAITNKDIDHPSEVPALINQIKGHPMAKAGLEMAFWDLFGKMTRSPLHVLLKGERNKIDVGISIGIQPDLKELFSKISNSIKAGYQRIKLKIRPGWDVDVISAVRKKFPDIDLQVDANSAYSLESAQSLIPLDNMELILIEQPLYEDDIYEHKKLQEQFQTPLCLDESILSVRHTRLALELDACKIINIKQGRVGGISESVLIHDLCFQNNIPVWCGGMLETGIGRAANLGLATLPGFRLASDISATDRYYEVDITNERFTLNQDSTINVPGKPGLGITINQAELDRVTLKKVMIEN